MWFAVCGAAKCLCLNVILIQTDVLELEACCLSALFVTACLNAAVYVISFYTSHINVLNIYVIQLKPLKHKKIHYYNLKPTKVHICYNLILHSVFYMFWALKEDSCKNTGIMIYVHAYGIWWVINVWICWNNREVILGHTKVHI